MKLLPHPYICDKDDFYLYEASLYIPRKILDEVGLCVCVFSPPIICDLGGIAYRYAKYHLKIITANIFENLPCAKCFMFSLKTRPMT